MGQARVDDVAAGEAANGCVQGLSLAAQHLREAHKGQCGMNAPLHQCASIIILDPAVPLHH